MKEEKKVDVKPVVRSPASEFLSKTCRGIITKIVAISPEFIPKYEHENDACCDLIANIPEGELVIGHGEIVKIDVGIKIQIPSGYEAQIRARSGWAGRGLMVVNGPGTIDSNFRDPLKVIVTNISDYPLHIPHLAKIAQMALKPVYYFSFESVDTLDKSERDGGFGSTGF
jgi:dUTP pyrophosphatase